MQDQSSFAGSLDAIAVLLEGTDYQARRFIGRGAIGFVFEVEHTFIGRSFALKVLQPDLPAAAAFADRMRVEAQILGRLNHPNSVEVVDFWVSSDGRPCLVMELLNGHTLAEELIERGQLTVDEVIAYGMQALGALVEAHALGVVHRDIKPENLFLHQMQGSGRSLKVLDFGIARVTAESVPRSPSRPEISTATGAFVGSPRYMSPEALRGEKVDARADIFSLGLVLYVALTGHGPFDFAADIPTPLADHGVAIHPELEAVLCCALQQRAENRFQSALDFLNALRPFAPSALDRKRHPPGMNH